MPSRSLHINFASTFDSFRIFSEKLAALKMKKISCTSIVPFSFLNLSQVLMHDFRYNYMVSKYGSRSKLLFTDTDSLFYDVKTDDLNRDFLEDLEYFDTSEYPREHFLHGERNKKVLEKMKDETHGVRCTPFYSLKKTHLWERKQQNLFPRTSPGGNFGIKIIKLVSSKNTNEMNQIRSENHQIYSLTLIKTSLLSYGDKRYIVTDSCHTVAYGNYKGLGIKFYACK